MLTGPKGVGVILSQKEGKFEKVVAYASKSLMEAQRKFHPMEGECYVLIWGIMHFRQYLHMNHFILRTNYKPLEWLITVSDAHGKKNRWIDMLHDFSFKIIHRPGLKHTNVDALSRNLVGLTTDDDDSVNKSRILEIYKLTHLKKKGRFFLFRLAKKQNGSVSGKRTRSLYNIMHVVLVSTIVIMPTAISCMKLMLYQRKTSPRSLFHMRQKIQKGVRLCRTMM